MALRPRTLESNRLRVTVWLGYTVASTAAAFLRYFICRHSNSTSRMRHVKWWAWHLAYGLAGIIPGTAIAGLTLLLLPAGRVPGLYVP